jgi:hypothetical protein
LKVSNYTLSAFNFAVELFVFFVGAPTEVVSALVGRIVVNMVNLVAQWVVVWAESGGDEAVDEFMMDRGIG